MCFKNRPPQDNFKIPLLSARLDVTKQINMTIRVVVVSRFYSICLVKCSRLSLYTYNHVLRLPVILKNLTSIENENWIKRNGCFVGNLSRIPKLSLL